MGSQLMLHAEEKGYPHGRMYSTLVLKYHDGSLNTVVGAIVPEHGWTYATVWHLNLVCLTCNYRMASFMLPKPNQLCWPTCSQCAAKWFTPDS